MVIRECFYLFFLFDHKPTIGINSKWNQHSQLSSVCGCVSFFICYIFSPSSSFFFIFAFTVSFCWSNDGKSSVCQKMIKKNKQKKNGSQYSQLLFLNYARNSHFIQLKKKILLLLIEQSIHIFVCLFVCETCFILCLNFIVLIFFSFFFFFFYCCCSNNEIFVSTSKDDNLEDALSTAECWPTKKYSMIVRNFHRIFFSFLLLFCIILINFVYFIFTLALGAWMARKL